MFKWIKELFKLIGMLFSSKPSDFEEPELLSMDKFPPSGNKFLMWCGRMVYRSSKKDIIDEYLETTLGKYSITHETIHLRQAQLKGSWIRYYWKYLWEWIKGNPITNPSRSAYYTIPYEMEAFGNDRDESYPKTYTGDYLWCYDISNRKKTYKANKSTWKEYCRSIEKILKD